MAITDIVPHKDGGAWGWDEAVNKWVPVDPTMLAGNPIANLGRGAALGFRQVGQGLSELLGSNDPATQQSGQVLKLQTEAAQNAAPWTTTIGMGAPEVLAGGAAALGTGGMSIPAMLLGQAGAGGLVGFMKPGDVSERVKSAAVGAVFAAGGAGLGEAAMRGISAGLMLGKSVTEGSVEATAQGVINGVAKQQNAEARAAMAGAADAEAGGGGSSVGAAETPGSQLDPVTAAEGAAMDQSESYNASRLSKGTQQKIIDNAQALGHEPAYWADSSKGSMARLLGSANEFNPMKEAQEATRVARNQELLNRAGARAMGGALTLDPVENSFTNLDLGAMETIRAKLDQGWDAVKGEMPGIGYGEFRKAIEAVDRPTDPGGVGKAYKMWRDSVMEDLNKAGDHASLSGEQFINQTRHLSHMMADAKSDPASIDKFIETQNQLYNMAEKATKADVSKGPHGGDQTITGKGWAELRKEEQAYMMFMRAGAVDGQGNVNPRTLKRLMANQKLSGGFGVRRGEMTPAQKDLYDLTLGHLQDDTGVPPTGARIVGALGGLARGVAKSKVAQGGMAGTAGITALNSIWGK